MKTISDPRHQKRRKVVQELFALSFPRPQGQTLRPKRANLTIKVTNCLTRIDQIIGQAAPAFPVDKISKIDLAILRLAVFELLAKTAPAKVIIDEAVELAKEFGGQNSSSFVNGVLGTVYKNLETKKLKN